MELNAHLRKRREILKKKNLNTNKKEGFGFDEGDEIVFVCMVEN